MSLSCVVLCCFVCCLVHCSSCIQSPLHIGSLLSPYTLMEIVTLLYGNLPTPELIHSTTEMLAQPMVTLWQNVLHRYRSGACLYTHACTCTVCMVICVYCMRAYTLYIICVYLYSTCIYMFIVTYVGGSKAPRIL